MLVQQESRGAAAHCLNFGVRWEWVVKTMLWPLYSLERAPLTIVQGVGWLLELAWVGVEERKSVAPFRLGTPKHPAHCKSLYWLCYPNPILDSNKRKKNWNIRSVSVLSCIILLESLAAMMCVMTRFAFNFWCWRWWVMWRSAGLIVGRRNSVFVFTVLSGRILRPAHTVGLLKTACNFKFVIE